MSDEIPAGRELDALVAERVMLWSNVGNRPDRMPTYLGGDGWSGRRIDEGDVLSDIPYYSTAIEAAWLLVEGLHADWCCSLRERTAEYDEWACAFDHRREVLSVNGSGNTAPLAICRAALKAVGPAGSHVRPSA